MTRVPLFLFLATAIAIAVAGCGGGGGPAAAKTSPAPAPRGSQAYAPTAPPARLRAERRALAGDVRTLRASAGDTSSLKGTPAQNRATDRFLHDLQRSHLPLLERNRWIDHAAAAIAGACEQCFQALEATRPIAAPTR
ncbi:MAG: hypothetical protein QOE36_296 [Gaiellaceae bacterium]|jgi:hypothetical protein|nr:hypothetical protein [Gaiellaceae bacterium]